MGIRFRKSKNIGPLRINLSKSGVGFSFGVKGARITKKANGGIRTTMSIPGTGIQSVTDRPSAKTMSKRKTKTARLRKQVQKKYDLSNRQMSKLTKEAKRNPRKFAKMSDDQVVSYARKKNGHGILFYLICVPVLLFIPIIGWKALADMLKD